MIQIHLKFNAYESAPSTLHCVSVYLMGRFQNIEKHIQNLKKFISLYLHFFSSLFDPVYSFILSFTF